MSIMKEYFDGKILELGPTEQQFKVKIGTGTASIQQQAKDEGFDEIENGGFTASSSGVLGVTGSEIKIVLTGDARFFMGIFNNRR